MIGYKVFNQKPGSDACYTMFHAVNGSKQIPREAWITAYDHWVIDGSKGKTYLSGFHFFKTYENAQFFLNSLQNTIFRHIVKCEFKDVWPKAHARREVFLAKKIYIFK